MYNNPYKSETGNALMPLDRYGGRYADELSTEAGRRNFARDVGYVDQNTGQIGFYKPNDLSPLAGLEDLNNPVVRQNYARLFDIGNSYFIPDFVEVDPYQYNYHSPMAEGRSREQQDIDFNRMYHGRNMAMNNAFTQGRMLEGVADPEQVMRELLNVKERRPEGYDDQLRQSAGLLAAFDVGRGDITYDQGQAIDKATEFQHYLDNMNRTVQQREQSIKNIERDLSGLTADPANMETYNQKKADYEARILGEQANLEFARKAQANYQASLDPYYNTIRGLGSDTSKLSSSDAINRLRFANTTAPTGQEVKMADGGMVLPLLAKSGGALKQYGGREDFKDGKHVAGHGDGQSDDIPAWLADGEFVFPADVVSALGNGSTKAGTDKLYEMMHSIRDRARSKGPKDLPPPALKSPLDYLKSSKRSAK
jgi:hypothetical protein